MLVLLFVLFSSLLCQANCLYAWNTAQKQPDYISDNLPYRRLRWKRIGYNIFHSQHLRSIHSL